VVLRILRLPSFVSVTDSAGESGLVLGFDLVDLNTAWIGEAEKLGTSAAADSR
jgi:hypothetical protein